MKSPRSVRQSKHSTERILRLNPTEVGEGTEGNVTILYKGALQSRKIESNQTALLSYMITDFKSPNKMSAPFQSTSLWKRNSLRMLGYS